MDAPFKIDVDKFIKKNTNVIRIVPELVQAQASAVCDNVWSYVTHHTSSIRVRWDKLYDWQKESVVEACEAELYAYLSSAGNLVGEYGVNRQGVMTMTNDQLREKQLCVKALDILESAGLWRMDLR